jgi:hypothetical protein
MFLASCASTTVVEKTKILCSGQIVTVDLSSDVLSNETARSILLNNQLYEACVEANQ